MIIIDMEKTALKEQAKSLLLKGCYKMAKNKYERLIQLGSQGFSQKEWSIIHLNQGICYQFLQQYDQALQLANRSIEIDPTYEKAYYRRIQMLREMKKFQMAIGSVPTWLRNKEIQELLKQIREEHFNSLGIDDLLENMSKEGEVNLQTTKEGHHQFYQKIVEQIDREENKNSWETISMKICKYYVVLKEDKKGEKMESFLNILHMLLVKYLAQTAQRKVLRLVFVPFWSEFIKEAEPFRNKQFSISDLKDKQEYKLVKYVPLCQQTLQFLNTLVYSQNLQSQQIFDYCLQMVDLMMTQQGCESFSEPVYQMITHLTSSLKSNMCHSLLGWLKRSFLLIDALIRLHLHFKPNLTIQNISLTNFMFIRYDYLNQHAQQVNIAPKNIFKISQHKLVQFLSNNLECFLILYSFQQFIHKLDRSTIKELLPDIEQQLDLLKDLKQLKCNSVLLNMQKQYELVLTAIMLKIDIKHSTTRVNIPALLSHKHNRATLYDQSLSDICINTLLLLAISSPANLNEILNHPHSITDIIREFLHTSFTQQLQSITIATSFIYIATVDLEMEQEKIYAKKMGVTVEEIEKVKKLQGEAVDPKLSVQIRNKKHKFIEYIAQHWAQTLTSLSMLLLKIKQEKCLKKWSKVINQIAKIDVTRLHHPKIIEVMLQSFKLQKVPVGHFFSLLCKKINTSLLSYPQLQSISNILISNIENGQHELVIFQSLLGLINLTSNSSTKVTVPIKPLLNCLFQQNKYIIHGGLELLNNVLINVQKQEIDKHPQLKECVEKYIKFFREQCNKNKEGVPLTDYSHPSRIYGTLISVAIVIDLEDLEEFQDWQHSQEHLLRMPTQRSLTFFKMAMYMSMKNKLKGKWWLKFDKQLLDLYKNNKGHWMKLKQHMY